MTRVVFNAIAVILLISPLFASCQEKINLYPNEPSIRIGGLNKISSPPFIEHFKVTGKANGSAILICPGGSYTKLSDQHEGVDVAQYYNQFGYDTFVLRYRLNDSDQSGSRYPDQYNDVTTAIRIIKSRATEWKINPDKVGILGFSAGGHLASMCATMHLKGDKKKEKAFEHVDSKPAFAILIYPVITLSGPATHTKSREMLLGKSPDPIMMDSLSTQNSVDANTPPVFLVYANDDKGVPPENGLLFYEALRKNNIPASLHIYDRGGHGFGMAPKDEVLNTWPLLSVKWLHRLGY
jgi:acetyl esterase/lipase